MSLVKVHLDMLHWFYTALSLEGRELHTTLLFSVNFCKPCIIFLPLHSYALICAVLSSKILMQYIKVCCNAAQCEKNFCKAINVYTLCSKHRKILSIFLKFSKSFLKSLFASYTLKVFAFINSNYSQQP